MTERVLCLADVLLAAAKAKANAPREPAATGATQRCDAIRRLRVEVDNCPLLETLKWEPETFPGLENRMADGARDANYGRIFVARTALGDFIRPSPELRNKPAKFEYEQFFGFGAGGLGWKPDRVVFLPRGNREG